MIIERSIPSTVLPFDVSDLESHSRTDGTTHFLAELIRMGCAAALEFEAYTSTALLTQSVTVTLDNELRKAWFDLPVAPLLDPLSVTVTVDGVAYDDFAVITGRRPALRFPNGKPCGLVVIEYEAGFGSTPHAIPAEIQNAILDQAVALFDLRGAGDGKGTGMSPHFARIAARYRRVAL